MLRENLLLNNYEGHIEATEIEPSHELIYFLCWESLEIFNGYIIISEHGKCGGSMDVYQVAERIPVDEFKKLSSIEAIEIRISNRLQK
ncbi:hypothetical protein [Bacillus thuringiensis]|uniref:hypothetical protein n=1 Tax=Bacillus thuringiensis TaxID=1428 RepID=UPI0005A3214E|nr:hypothetical protein [Bacillus thuringiensis]AJI31802.1 hypothetical protein BG06_5451 [Bacillus thuringiensis]QKI23399.1 hypothetical protein FOC86_00260 [Bacillus thuringiensis]